MPKSNHNFEQLEKIIVEESDAEKWDDAVKEWAIEDLNEFENEDEISCVCGRHPLKYVFALRNAGNNNLISRIGSVCIKHFGEIKLKRVLYLLNRFKEIYRCACSSQNLANKNDDLISLLKPTTVDIMYYAGFITERERDAFTTIKRRKKWRTKSQEDYLYQITAKIRRACLEFKQKKSENFRKLIKVLNEIET